MLDTKVKICACLSTHVSCSGDGDTSETDDLMLQESVQCEGIREWV